MTCPLTAHGPASWGAFGATITPCGNRQAGATSSFTEFHPGQVGEGLLVRTVFTNRW